MSHLPPGAIYILRKLYAKNKVGEIYINNHKLMHFFPRHLRSWGLLREWVKELQKEEMVILHKNGTCISLNPRKLGEIEKLI
jgi:hypothetical protein